MKPSPTPFLLDLLAMRPVRVGLLVVFLLAMLGFSYARAEQGSVPAKVSALQRDVRTLQQQVRQLLEHERAQNQTITQLTAIVNSQSQLIGQLQRQNQALQGGLGCASLTGCSLQVRGTSVATDAQSADLRTTSNSLVTQTQESTTSVGGVVIGDLNSMTIQAAEDGTSQVEGARTQIATSGSSNVTQVLATHAVAQQVGSGFARLVRGSHSQARVDGGGAADTLIGASAQVAISGTGRANQAQVLRAVAPELESTASIGTIEGLRIANIANARVSNVYGVRVEDQVGSGGLVIGLRSELTSGLNKWNIYQTGSAPNVLEALTIFGTDRGVRFENQSSGSLTWGRPPDFLLKINVNGVEYVIPCWRG